jgi:tetratricopeptide (TPR) repeat protein
MLYLGELYARGGAFADALEPLEAAAKLDPKAFDAWHNLGLSLYWLRRYQEALPVLEKAAAMNPKFFDTLNLLASTYHALGNDEAALPIMERAHALNPGDAKLAAALERMKAAKAR